MFSRKKLLILACSVALSCCASSVVAKVKLPKIIGDNMVLQRGQPIPIWGWAEKGEEVVVALAGQEVKTTTGDNGRWKVVLEKLDVGKPLQMTVKGSSGNTITLKNILVGEVWFCSGQSNMGIPVVECNNAEQEIANSDYPQIRLLIVWPNGSQEPQYDITGGWNICGPNKVGRFPGVAYFFARRLHKELNVPIGLIACAWGGSSCETWVNRPALEAAPAFKPMIAKWDKMCRDYDHDKAVAEWNKNHAAWKKQAEADKAAGKQAKPEPPKLKNILTGQNRPANCYNGMMMSVIPYGIRGAIWYQGESNASRAFQYRELFPLMIREWRKDWAQGDFPFYYVQLPNYTAVQPLPGESAWAELREAQTMTLSYPNTGMAVSIDIGDEKNIHPKNKQDVGNRLALWGLAKTYGKNIVYSGPLYRSMEKKGNEIAISFEHIGSGLASKDGVPLKGFAIAGADKKFVWADAQIVGDTVVVKSDAISDPVAVRYAWANNPVCNLYNKEGLPASPFRTDSWKGITEK